MVLSSIVITCLFCYDYRLFIPVLLAVTCGLRRGEICALRWRNVRLTGAAELAIVGSTEQTKAGIREKETKSGRARTVALTTLAIDELRLHKVRQAQELLRLGIRQSDDMYVVAQADGQPLKPNSLTHEFARFIVSTALPRVRFHDLRHRRTCWQAVSIQRSRRSGLATPRSRLHWTYIRTCFPECRQTPRSALTKCCDKR